MKPRNLAILSAIIVVAALGYTFWPRTPVKSPSTNDQNQTVCTQDAKQCPDGSYVSRVAPSCDFAPCPQSGSQTPPIPSNWKTAKTEGQDMSFQYPPDFNTPYVTAQEWPPKITVGTGSPACAGEQTTINGHQYCVQVELEGAAGSTYETYTMTGMKDGKLVRLNFVLGEPNCLNYSEPQQSACQDAQKKLSIGSIIDQIVQSLK